MTTNNQTALIEALERADNFLKDRHRNTYDDGPVWIDGAAMSLSLQIRQALAGASIGGAADSRAIVEALGFDPTNHHNAAKCPYCTQNGKYVMVEAQPIGGEDLRALEQLNSAANALLNVFAEFGEEAHKYCSEHVEALEAATAVAHAALSATTEDKP